MRKSKFFTGYLCVFALAAPAFGAATIGILNGDPANVGLNDATIVAPVGGNPGTTLGQQRLNVLQHVANIWGAQLTSVPTIRILTTFEALTCTATAAVYASGGATEVFRDFTGAPLAGHWYPKALAGALSGTDLDTATADIRLRINRNLGNAGCLTGNPFYLGLDNNHGSNPDLVTYLLHEVAHGLGFQTFTNGQNGAYLAGFPAAADAFLYDNTLNLSWDQMTASERATSSLNTGHLVWNGPNVTAGVPTALSTGVPEMSVSGPAAVAGSYLIGTASFGPALSATPVTGDLMPITTDGCAALTGLNAQAVNGNIALIDQGTCVFNVKVKNAQDAGALGVVIANDVAGSPPPGMGGTDPTITIPSVRITQADGVKLKNQLKFRSRTKSGVVTTLRINNALFNGADAAGRIQMFAPNPFQSGSSVQHFDPSASPNQLMEPAIAGDLTHSVGLPDDLTRSWLKDIGWF